MMVLFDQAKKHQALVVGTENKTENYLGYFTRFGDAASDLEPIANLYKTEVRQLAGELNLSEKIIKKPPSAGLWAGQIDESEFGFSYDQADEILMELEKTTKAQKLKMIAVIEKELDQDKSISETRKKILERVKNNWFKQEVPYKVL
jgi:NAD+ synthase